MTASREHTPIDASTPGAGMTFFQYDWDEHDSLAVEIVTMVAEISDEPPEALESIHNVVDSDSLETIFEPRSAQSRRDNNHIWFAYEGFGITIYGNGFVIIRRLN
ncbi:HalOD1 output domain-containing protein [Halostagnicola bangensis]